ncbi:MAG TPA: VWA domain-containing protein [Candidatus Saccharimonadales bacterium]|nr:VWA domain-containing protein [Candidatus Saccharimonadales bacterium]
MSRLLALVFGVAFLAALVDPAVALADDTVRLNVTQIDPSDFPNVRIVASAADAQGKPVKGLQATDLIVSESSRAQRIGVDLANTVAPIALVLVLDTSGSMAGKPFADAKAAMNSLAQSLGPKDQGAIVTFNTAVSIPQPLTSDKAALAAAIDRATAGGDTAIFDALSAAADLIAPVPASSRRAIVLLTDGIDNSSKATLASATAKMAALKAPAYVIGLGTDLDRPVLQALADGSTGGAAYVAPTSAQLAGIYAGLSEQIATEYVVSYHSDVREVAAGTTLEVTLQLIRAGSVIATTTASFVVPVGHDVKPAAIPTIEPAPAQELPAVPVIGPTRVGPAIVALLGVGSALCLLLWALVLSTTQSLADRERRRMNDLAGGIELLDRPGARPFRDRVIVPFLQRLARPFQRFMPSSEGTRLRLAQAGDPLDLGPAEFLGLRVASGFIFAIVGVVIAAAFKIDLLLLLLATLFGLFLGYALPGIALGRAIRARQRAIQRALPAALDMLALSAGAGLTFDGAVGQVVERWHTPLSDELRRLLVEFRMGSERRVALRGLARRTGLADVGRFVNAIIQADSLGVPISRVLSEQAGEMRTRRRQRAEEAARTAPVKMLFPMVGLIFPALFVVILGPAVPRFLTLFSNAH